MTPRSFLQNQLRDEERAKLAALPTNDTLNLLFGQKQPLDASLTTLSGKTIGAKGLDLLASSTSAAAINVLGGSGGQIVSAMVASLDAAKLTGTIDVARLPVIPGNNSLSATSIAGLTTLQQAAVSLGTMVYTADGGAWRYSGSGLKTAEASYYYTADVTPEWNAIANKPALATAAQGALADTALQPGASAEVLSEGATKKLLTAAERTKLAGIAAGATANATDASLRDRSTHTGEQAVTTITGLAAVAVSGSYGDLSGRPTFGTAASQDASAFATSTQFNTLDAGKFDKAGGALSGDVLIQKTNNPALVVRALDNTSAYLRLRNSLGFFDLSADPAGRLSINNYNADDTYQNTPMYFENDGTPTFLVRPTFNGSALATLAEATGGSGGVAGVSSIFGRTGPVAAQTGDYTSAQISHAGGTVSDVLSNSLLKAGGDMTGPLGLAGTGGNFFAAGTGDGATFTTYNMKLRGHWGMAMETYDGSVFGVYDFRTGTWDVMGGYKVNGVAVATEFDTLDGGAI